MGELQSVLDGFTAVTGADLDDHGPAALLERTAALLRLHNQVTAELTRTIGRADAVGAAGADGLASMPAWLRGHGRLPAGTATGIVGTARALAHLPAAAAAAGTGALHPRTVDLLAQIAEPRRLAQAAAADIDLAAIDADFTALALDAPFKKTARVGGDLPRPPGRRRHRTRPRWTSGSCRSPRIRTGTCRCAGTSTRSVGRNSAPPWKRSAPPAARKAISGPATSAKPTPSSSCATCTSPPGNLPVLRTVKPHAGLIIPLADLADPTPAPGAGEGTFVPTLSAAQARWLACDADLARIVLGPGSEPLDLGRTRRLVTPALRRAVVARDKHCVFAGCDAPSWWCEVHHLIFWLFGGETSLHNSGLLCERHHGKAHSGYTLKRDPGGRWHTYRPDGTEIIIPTPLEDPGP